MNNGTIRKTGFGCYLQYPCNHSLFPPSNTDILNFYLGRNVVVCRRRKFGVRFVGDENLLRPLSHARCKTLRYM